MSTPVLRQIEGHPEDPDENWYDRLERRRAERKECELRFDDPESQRQLEEFTK